MACSSKCFAYGIKIRARDRQCAVCSVAWKAALHISSAAATALVEGKLGKSLKKVLKKVVAKEAHEQLAIHDAKLGGVIKVGGLSCCKWLPHTLHWMVSLYLGNWPHTRGLQPGPEDLLSRGVLSYLTNDEWHLFLIFTYERCGSSEAR